MWLQVGLASRIEHSWICAALSLLCFILAMVSQLPALASALPSAARSGVYAAGMAATYFLSGVPQVVSSIAIASSGHLDTHVLMALAVAGTLYLGMVHEVRFATASWVDGGWMGKRRRQYHAYY